MFANYKFGSRVGYSKWNKKQQTKMQKFRKKITALRQKIAQKQRRKFDANNFTLSASDKRRTAACREASSSCSSSSGMRSLLLTDHHD